MPTQVTSSRAGVPIRLTDERWEHIRTRHPALRGRQARVLETVADPDVLRVNDLGQFCAIRAYGDMPPRWRRLIVVYQETSQDDGYIVTAYPAHAEPKGRRLWTRSFS
jgi:hypothetical protein